MGITVHARNLKALFAAPYYFSIPSYQRPYKWGKDEIEDLLTDINDAYITSGNKKDAQYFLGAVVLQQKKSRGRKKIDIYEVLDGQQRLTTLFITYAVLSQLVKDDDSRLDLRKKVLQSASRVDGEPAVYRIKYEREDVNRIITRLLNNDEDDKLDATDSRDYDSRGVEDVSSKNFIRAFNIIKNYFQNFIAENDDGTLIDFSNFLTTKVIIIDVSANTHEDAFRLFSILNNRGIQLNAADILKAENIGSLQENQKRTGTQDWEKVENGLKDEDFDGFLQFIRTIYLKAKPEGTLLEEFDNKIYKGKLLTKGADTINTIREYYDIYEDIITCYGLDDIVTKKENNVKYKQLIHIMRRSIKSKDWIPPTMFFYKKFIQNTNDKNFKLMIDFLERLEFKFAGDWICGEKPTARRNAMYEILKQIENSASAKAIIDNEELFCIDEGKLRGVLNEKIYGEDYATYVLLKLEYLCSSHDNFTEYKRVSIEHILPQTIDGNSHWKEVFGETTTYWMHRLANLILLSPRKNTSLRNADFSTKKVRYYTKRGIDSFNITNSFLNYQSYA